VQAEVSRHRLGHVYICGLAWLRYNIARVPVLLFGFLFFPTSSWRICWTFCRICVSKEWPKIWLDFTDDPKPSSFAQPSVKYILSLFLASPSRLSLSFALSLSLSFSVASHLVHFRIYIYVVALTKISLFKEATRNHMKYFFFFCFTFSTFFHTQKACYSH